MQKLLGQRPPRSRLIVGALIEPARPQISQNGESLIALGLAFILIGVGFFLAYANPTA